MRILSSRLVSITEMSKLDSIPSVISQPLLHRSVFENIHHNLTIRECARNTLQQESSSDFSTSVGEANPGVNRYSNVLPFNKNRVKLPVDGYVNASHIEEPDLFRWKNHTARQKWIATQGREQALPFRIVLKFQYRAVRPYGI